MGKVNTVTIQRSYTKETLQRVTSEIIGVFSMLSDVEVA